MIEIKTDIAINRPLEEIFEFMADFDNDVHWWREVLESRRISGGKLGVGTTYWQKSRIMGRTSETTFEITEYELCKKVSIKTLTGPMPYIAGYIFEAAETGTRVTFSAKVKLAGLFKVAEPILACVLKKMTQANVGNLKRLLEASSKQYPITMPERTQARKGT